MSGTSSSPRKEDLASRPPARLSPVSVLAALLLALRPKQWTKNLLLFAGLLFTLDQRHPAQDFLRAAVGFLLFCLLSGCVYLINDLVDVEADRKHPKKRLRPIASGRLPVPVARIAAFVIAPLSLALATLLGVKFFAAALIYLLIALAYSFHLKHVVLMDLMALSAGFVLRAAAGSFAVGVANSEWLLLCTTLLALFIGLAKRRGELTALGDNPATRRILADYSIPMLDQMITIVASACLMAYSLYTFFSATGKDRPYLMATIPFVIYGLFRYLYLAHRKGMGEAPETVLLEDRPLLVNVLLWILTTLAVMLLGRL